MILSFQNRKRLNQIQKNRKQGGCFAGFAVLPIGS